MSNYYVVEPEVAGGCGPHSVVDQQHGRPKVLRLHYVFEGWLGDDLLESTPCFIILNKPEMRAKHKDTA